jgi:small nuclear ribonucleoprotein (snRNP)-like protein
MPVQDRSHEDDRSPSPIENEANLPAEVQNEDEVFVLDDFGADAQASRGNPDLTGSAPLPTEGDPDTYVLGESEAGTAFSPELEMVELGAAAGEAAAVEPPVEALSEAAPAPAVPEVVYAAPPVEATNVKPMRRMWIPLTAAAIALFGVGGYYMYDRYMVELSEETTTAHVPVKPPVGTKPDVKPAPPVAVRYTRPEPSEPPGPEVPAPVEPPVAEATPTDPNLTPDPNATPEPEVAVAEPAEMTAGETPVEPVQPDETAEPSPSEAGVTTAALTRGTEVLVRLRNGNFFNGKLDRFTTEEARLRFPKGTIEFQVRDVEVILPIAQAPKKAGPQTVIELRNGNKLAGRLVEDLPNHVTLAVGNAEITLPRTAIASVTLRSPLGLVMGDGAPPPPSNEAK